MKSDSYKSESLNDPNKLPRNIHKEIEATEPKMRGKPARKRKCDDIGDDSPDDSFSISDFVRSDSITKPTILNSRDAFFDKNHAFTSLLTDSPAESSIDKECVIKTSKSFFDDGKCEDREGSYRYTPRRSPTSFRRELQTKPMNSVTYGGTPCGVVDELFTGLYGCMPSWECSLPWTEDDSDESDDEPSQRYGMVHRDITRHDPKAIREHLSFPKHLGKEYVSKTEQASPPQRKNRTFNRTIRRSPSSRLTTVESDSRQKLPGSKMIRRTEINRVTEIHWDEEVLDMKTLEQMAKLSVY